MSKTGEIQACPTIAEIRGIFGQVADISGKQRFCPKGTWALVLQLFIERIDNDSSLSFR
jgi:hypothetical protein